MILSNNIMHIGKIINLAIQEKGIKKVELAKRINKSSQALNSILSRPYCSTDIIEAISKALDVNIFILMGKESQLSGSYEYSKRSQSIVE